MHRSKAIIFTTAELPAPASLSVETKVEAKESVNQPNTSQSHDQYHAMCGQILDQLYRDFGKFEDAVLSSFYPKVGEVARAKLTLDLRAGALETELREHAAWALYEDREKQLQSLEREQKNIESELQSLFSLKKIVSHRNIHIVQGHIQIGREVYRDNAGNRIPPPKLMHEPINLGPKKIIVPKPLVNFEIRDEERHKVLKDKLANVQGEIIKKRAYLRILTDVINGKRHSLTRTAPNCVATLFDHSIPRAKEKEKPVVASSSTPAPAASITM